MNVRWVNVRAPEEHISSDSFQSMAGNYIGESFDYENSPAPCCRCHNVNNLTIYIHAPVNKSRTGKPFNLTCDCVYYTSLISHTLCDVQFVAS